MELLWKAAVQGIVQGITEFLPVSSTAHLLLFGKMLDMGHPEFVKIFNIVVQLASILAIAIYFRNVLIPVKMFSDREVRNRTFQLWGKMIIGVIPILIIGAVVAKLGWKDAMHERPLVMVCALFIGGLLLLRIEDWCKRENPVSDFSALSYKTAFLIGLIQCMAIVPGTSRSASTIIGALALGLARPMAAEFSFLLAIPTMTAASAYSLLKHHSAMSGEEWTALAIGCAVTFLVSLGAVSWMMKFIKTHTFQLFGWYRMALALAVGAFIFFSK